MPDGMPLIVQGVLGDNGDIDPHSVAVYPLMRGATLEDEGDAPPDMSLLSNVVVLPRLPVGMGALGKRLIKQLEKRHDDSDNT